MLEYLKDFLITFHYILYKVGQIKTLLILPVNVSKKCLILKFKREK